MYLYIFICTVSLAHLLYGYVTLHKLPEKEKNSFGPQNIICYLLFFVRVNKHQLKISVPPRRTGFGVDLS